MPDKHETDLINLLRKAQMMMVELSGQYTCEEQRNWDKAQALLDGARQIDSILQLVSQASGNTSDRKGKFPYYYVEYDKLVKVGRSRDGGTYEHRVTKEHYDLIVGRLSGLAKKGETFETRRLVSLCKEVPAHEPLIVVNLLGEHGILTGLRRGRWSFADAEGFLDAVRGIWDKLKNDNLLRKAR